MVNGTTNKYTDTVSDVGPGKMKFPIFFSKIAEMGNFLEKQGEHKSRYQNGQPRLEEFWKNDELVGERKMWYGNGQLWEKEFYRNGRREGERKMWFRNGQLWTHLFYKNGKPEGEGVIHDPEGNRIIQTFWREGKKITKKEFYKKGLFLLNDKLYELGLKEIIFSFL